MVSPVVEWSPGRKFFRFFFRQNYQTIFQLIAYDIYIWQVPGGLAVVTLFKSDKCP